MFSTRKLRLHRGQERFRCCAAVPAVPLQQCPQGRMLRYACLGLFKILVKVLRVPHTGIPGLALGPRMLPLGNHYRTAGFYEQVAIMAFSRACVGSTVAFGARAETGARLYGCWVQVQP